MGTFIPDGWFRAGAKEAGMKGWRVRAAYVSQRKPQSRQNEVRPGAPRCSPRGYHRRYINVEVASEVWNVTGLTGLTGLGGADARHTKRFRRFRGLGGLEGSGSSEGLEVSGGSDVVERKRQG